MADKEIGALTAAGALDGTELAHVVQSGNSRQTTTQDVANLYVPWDFSPPTAASFSLMNSDGTNLSLSDDTDVGCLIDLNGLSAGAARFAYRTLSTPASAWDMKVKLHSCFSAINFCQVGLMCFNSSNDRHNRNNIASNSGWFVGRYSNKTTLSASLLTGNNGAVIPVWLRIAFDGTNIIYYGSNDGKIWNIGYTETPGTYLTAAGGSVDRVGIMMHIVRATNDKPVASCPYFSLTGPGV